MEKYYRIEHDINQEVIGVRDGLAQLEIVEKKFLDKRNFDFYMDWCVHKIDDTMSSFPDRDIKLEYIGPRKGAKLTDFTQISPGIFNKYVISPKVQSLLKRFNTAAYKLYDAAIYFNDTPDNSYKFFYCPMFGHEHIDFSRSSFSTGDDIVEEKKQLDIKSFEELRKTRRMVNMDKIVLFNHFDKTLDLFMVRLLRGIVVSKRMKDAFNDEGVTGLKITPLPEKSFDILE